MSSASFARKGLCRVVLIASCLLLPIAAYGAQAVIEGVPDYQQDNFAGINDCTPVAAANVLGYWDAHGFPDLIDGSNDYAANPSGVTALVDLLKQYMWWTSAGTSLDMIKPGLNAAIRQRGYLFSVNNDYAVTWDDVRAEIDCRRVPILTMYHPMFPTLHSAATLGYADTAGAAIVIIHDNWYPANDVYLNLAEASGTLMTKVAPYLFVDDDAPGDPGPGTPLVSDPLENGSPAHPFDSLQEAVNAAADGIVVTIAPGSYSGPGNRDVDLLGKSITLRGAEGPSRCVIDCEGSESQPHRAFIFQNGESRECTVQGISIRNGWSTEGGAILCKAASPTIRNCIIAFCSAGTGGAIFSRDASPLVDNCTISRNAAGTGGGIWFEGAAAPTVANSILWGNAGGSLVPAGAAAAYSCIEGGYAGKAILAADPLLADAAKGDFHLMSRFGRWNPAANGGKGGYAYDAQSSPGLDQGDPDAPYMLEPEPNLQRVNLGAYGNTPEASISGIWWNLPGDANDDCKVNILDMILIRNALGLDPSSGGTWKKDVNRDGRINILDLIFVRNWNGEACY